MKKPWRIAGLVLAGLFILVVMSATLLGPREPEYEGRTLTAWLETSWRPSPFSPRPAPDVVRAFQHMGTNAVPHLVRMLHAKDSALKVKFINLVSRQRWMDFHFRFDFQRRSDALRGLGILGPAAKAAIPEVARLLNDQSEADSAARTLYQIGPEAVPALQQAVTSKNTWTRKAAVGYLGMSGAAEVVPDLITALRDPDFITRSKAAQALTKFPGQADLIVPALIACFEDRDETFRSNAADSLRQFGDKAKPAIPGLMKMVVSTNYHESMTAAKVLMKLDPQGALAAFIKNLESDDVVTRRTTASALMTMKVKGRPAVPALVKCLKDPDNKVKENAAVALREIAQDPDLVVPALMENLNDPDLKVRSITAIALCNFGERAKPAVPRILKLIEENKDDEFTASGLFNALARIDPEAAAKLNGE